MLEKQGPYFPHPDLLPEGEGERRPRWGRGAPQAKAFPATDHWQPGTNFGFTVTRGMLRGLRGFDTRFSRPLARLFLFLHRAEFFDYWIN